jgi:outer membrane protein
MSFALSAVPGAARKSLPLAAALLACCTCRPRSQPICCRCIAMRNPMTPSSPAPAQLVATREKLPQGARACCRRSLARQARSGPGRLQLAGRRHPLFQRQHLALQLTQPLFRWDRWETYKQGELAALAGEVTFQQAQLDLITRASQAYFDVLAAQDNLYLAGAQKKAIGEQLEQAKRNFEVGTATITDANDAQARYDLATSTEIASQSALEVSRATLQQITGKSVDELMGLRPKRRFRARRRPMSTHGRRRPNRPIRKSAWPDTTSKRRSAKPTRPRQATCLPSTWSRHTVTPTPRARPRSSVTSAAATTRAWWACS